MRSAGPKRTAYVHNCIPQTKQLQVQVRLTIHCLATYIRIIMTLTCTCWMQPMCSTQLGQTPVHLTCVVAQRVVDTR
jgi:hypothetical protein